MKILSVAIVTVILFACGSLATPYQRFTLEGLRIGGYQDKLISAKDSKYFVSFGGNGATKLNTAIEYWKRRANELCPHGFTIERMRAETPEGIGQGEVYVEGMIIPVTYKTKTPDVSGEIVCK